MRQEILDYINTLALGGYLLSQELPWTDSGTPLYLKNPKKIYVDVPEFINESILRTLSGTSINNEQKIVRIYFASDAKQIPSNYDTIVDDLKLAKDITTIEGVSRRECNVTKTFENDLLVTELELRFTNLSS